ncbi:unnamed protein product [Menidia menidia]|uniref:(Atlantic silverside) hypothetical protein n=1 Tax=Menidia menidia TaxID=238744 RepID=A0A8S4B8Z3_9TELE|nr:unnamed protein product [Menidia menidia]
MLSSPPPPPPPLPFEEPPGFELSPLLAFLAGFSESLPDVEDSTSFDFGIVLQREQSTTFNAGSKGLHRGPLTKRTPPYGTRGLLIIMLWMSKLMDGYQVPALSDTFERLLEPLDLDQFHHTPSGNLFLLGRPSRGLYAQNRLHEWSDPDGDALDACGGAGHGHAGPLTPHRLRLATLETGLLPKYSYRRGAIRRHALRGAGCPLSPRQRGVAKPPAEQVIDVIGCGVGRCTGAPWLHSRGSESAADAAREGRPDSPSLRTQRQQHPDGGFSPSSLPGAV